MKAILPSENNFTKSKQLKIYGVPEFQVNLNQHSENIKSIAPVCKTLNMEYNNI